MSKWHSYGQWRHPLIWWQIALLHYFKVKHPEKIKYNPKIISLSEDRILFGMRKHYGQLSLSKKIILESISSQLN